MNNFCYCGVEQLLFTIAQEQLLFLIFTKLFMICPLAVLGEQMRHRELRTVSRMWRGGTDTGTRTVRQLLVRGG